MRYRVFLGAPPTTSNGSGSHQWRTITIIPPSNTPTDRIQSQQSSELSNVALPIHLLSPEDLESASQRISSIYHGITFPDQDNESLEASDFFSEEEDSESVSISRGGSGSSLFSRNEISLGPELHGVAPSERSAFRSTQNESLRSGFSESYLSESDNSIALFPNFQFSLHGLSSLSALMDSPAQGFRAKLKRTMEISFLAAVLEIGSPEAVRLKTGPDAGNEVALLKLIVGDDGGTVIKITAWRETAEIWSGSDEADHPAIKKGDIVCFTNVLYTEAPPEMPIITASPKLSSSHEVCYRTLPMVLADRRVTPNLRLGMGDAGVRRVHELAKWVESVAGLSRV